MNQGCMFDMAGRLAAQVMSGTTSAPSAFRTLARCIPDTPFY
jgi:hypothetical protein